MTRTGTFATLTGVLAAGLLALAEMSCDLGVPLGSHERGPALDVLYSSSFETDTDTSGWIVNSAVRFASEAAPRGGGRSLRVAGGCVVPHGLVYLGRSPHSGLLQLRLWGRNLLGGGGGVALGSGTWHGFSQPQVSIFIADSVWTTYASDLLPCTAGDTLWIEFTCGGLVPAGMLVDLVEVARVSG